MEETACIVLVRPPAHQRPALPQFRTPNQCSVTLERTGRKKPSTYPGETACGKNPLEES